MQNSKDFYSYLLELFNGNLEFRHRFTFVKPVLNLAL